MEFQIAAISILTVFYGCYFWKMIFQKRRGIQTDQLGRGKAGFVKYVEITVKFAAILVLAAELVSIFAGTAPASVPIRIAGAAVSTAGTVLLIASVLTMGDSWRAGVPETGETELVTKGIYQISRNPAFLGFDLLYIGILLMFFNWVLWGITVFAVLMYHLQVVNVEEEFLLAAFGDRYLEYRKKVCRYIGRRR